MMKISTFPDHSGELCARLDRGYDSCRRDICRLEKGRSA